MEIQKTSNSQSNPEKEEWNWRNQPAWLQALLQSHSHQGSVVLAQRQKYRSMEQNRKPRDKFTYLWTPSYSFFPFIFISWRPITLQYCNGFCHTLTWISHGFTCIPHPDPPSHLPLHPIPLGLPSEHLSHVSSLGWWSVSPLIIYMFRCCSL